MTTSKKSTSSNVFQETIEAHKAYKAKLKQLSQKQLQEACAKFFDENPAVLAFSWIQWIPGFNDGDPCTFTLGEPSVLWKLEAMEQKPGARDWDKKPLVAKFWEKDPTEEEIQGFSESELGREEAEFGIPDGARLKKEFEGSDEAFSHLWGDLAGVEEVLESIFGTNAHVIVTRENIVVNDYDCGYQEP